MALNESNYDLNEYFHRIVTVNYGPGILSHATGHLRYEKGRGVVKTEEADCKYCERDGLNDGRWRPLPLRRDA